MTELQLGLMCLTLIGLLWFGMFSLIAECITKKRFFGLDIHNWKRVYRVLLKISFIFLWPIYFGIFFSISVVVTIIKTILAIFE